MAQIDGFWIYHAAPGDDGNAALGYLFIESDRHAVYLDDLTDAEAAALGRIRTQLAAALRAELDPEHVFTAVIGRSEPHFHEHVFCRHAGTPHEVSWHHSDDFAPRADADEVRDLTRRLARRLKTQE